jgi:hypothetical protein
MTIRHLVNIDDLATIIGLDLKGRCVTSITIHATADAFIQVRVTELVHGDPAHKFTRRFSLVEMAPQDQSNEQSAPHGPTGSPA